MTRFYLRNPIDTGSLLVQKNGIRWIVTHVEKVVPESDILHLGTDMFLATVEPYSEGEPA